MEKATVTSPPSIVVRLLAKAIDGIIVLILLEVFKTPGFLAGLIYVLIADGLFEGRSIGKYLTHLKVIKLDGSPAKTKESVIRNSPLFIALLISKIPFLGPIIGVLIVLFELVMIIGSPGARRFGDEIARTEVREIC